MGCLFSKTATETAEAKTLLTCEADGKMAKAEPEVKVSVDVIQLLDDIFEQLDINGDGFVSKSELSASLDNVLECSHVESKRSFRVLLAESGLNPYLNIFDQLDTNQDGKVSREEFRKNMHPAEAAKTIEQMLKDVFDRIDENGDGSLSREEVSRAFAHILEKSCVKSRKNFRTLMVDAGMNPDFFVFEQLDANNDGRVTWEEFRSRLQPSFDVMDFLRSVFSQIDADGNGAVSREELTKMFESALDCSDMKSKKTFRTLVQEAGLDAAFYVFGQPSAGGGASVTWDEFQASLRPAAAGQDAEDIARSAKADVVVEETQAAGSGGCLCGGR